MKKFYALGFTTLLAFATRAQTSIPNGDFETWQSGAYEVPTGYSCSNPGTFFHCNSPFNVVKWPDPYHGSYSVKLTTNAGAYDTCIGYMVNSPHPGDNNPCLWNGGMAYNQIPTALRGYYKCNVMPGDSAGILIGFRNGTTCLGFYFKKFAGVQNTYAPFQIDFNPPISGTPDTMVFAAVSSDVFNNIQIAGSTFQLDSLSFVGAPAPAAFDGDFENWQSVSVEKPLYWFVNGDDQGSGVYKTTDMYSNSYAAEIRTYLGGSKTGPPLARSGQLSTGYYLNNCQGFNCMAGGFPFTNQVDTLCFYYKYNPVNGDTANAWLYLKKNGNNVGGMSFSMNTLVSTYAYQEVPFSSFNPIDSAIVGFQSSSWRDSLPSFVGSDLKIDYVHFKSQTNGIESYDGAGKMTVFPNPSVDGSFAVSNVGPYDLVRVYDVCGREVAASIRKKDGTAQIHIDSPGAYTVFINSRGRLTNLKVIVGKE